MMTKKHFKAIACILRNACGINIDELDRLVKAFADYFAVENPNFDRAKFIDAVWKGK